MSAVRMMEASDLLELQSTNLDPLTETYGINFYLEYLIKWPELCYVIVSYDNRIEGYILGKVESSPSPYSQPSELPYDPATNTNDKYLPWHAHITALSIAPDARRLGHARKLSEILEQKGDEQNAYFVDLFVRVENETAIALYRSMGYSVFRRVVKYYNDQSDAFDMRKPLARDLHRKTVRADGENHLVDPEDVWEMYRKTSSAHDKIVSKRPGAKRKRRKKSSLRVHDDPIIDKPGTPKAALSREQDGSLETRADNDIELEAAPETRTVVALKCDIPNPVKQKRTSGGQSATDKILEKAHVGSATVQKNQRSCFGMRPDLHSFQPPANNSDQDEDQSPSIIQDILNGQGQDILAEDIQHETEDIRKGCQPNAVVEYNGLHLDCGIKRADDTHLDTRTQKLTKSLGGSLLTSCHFGGQDQDSTRVQNIAQYAVELIEEANKCCEDIIRRISEICRRDNCLKPHTCICDFMEEECQDINRFQATDEAEQSTRIDSRLQTSHPPPDDRVNMGGENTGMIPTRLPSGKARNIINMCESKDTKSSLTIKTLEPETHLVAIFEEAAAHGVYPSQILLKEHLLEGHKTWLESLKPIERAWLSSEATYRARVGRPRVGTAPSILG